LTVVEIPHDRTSPVADTLEPLLGGTGYQNLLVVAKNGRHFFGSGTVVKRLQAQFGGWIGGMLPERGFWGVEMRLPLNELLACIESAIRG
jgi:hypothetical protein